MVVIGMTLLELAEHTVVGIGISIVASIIAMDGLVVSSREE